MKSGPRTATPEVITLAKDLLVNGLTLDEVGRRVGLSPSYVAKLARANGLQHVGVSPRYGKWIRTDQEDAPMTTDEPWNLSQDEDEAVLKPERERERTNGSGQLRRFNGAGAFNEAMEPTDEFRAEIVDRLLKRISIYVTAERFGVPAAWVEKVALSAGLVYDSDTNLWKQAAAAIDEQASGQTEFYAAMEQAVTPPTPERSVELDSIRADISEALTLLAQGEKQHAEDRVTIATLKQENKRLMDELKVAISKTETFRSELLQADRGRLRQGMESYRQEMAR